MQFLLFTLMTLPIVTAMVANPNAFFETQPDGERVQLHIHGSHAYNYMSDSQGMCHEQYKKNSDVWTSSRPSSWIIAVVCNLILLVVSCFCFSILSFQAML